MKIIRYLVAAFLGIGLIRLLPRLARHINEGYPAGALTGEIIAILIFAGLAVWLVVWKKKK